MAVDGSIAFNCRTTARPDPASHGFARMVESRRRESSVSVGHRAEREWPGDVVVAPSGAAMAAAPPRPVPARVPLVTWATAVMLGVLFPLAGATLVAIAILDWTLVRRVPALRQLLD